MRDVNKRRDAFRRIVPKRVDSVLNSLRILGNCGNRGNYDYDEADIKKIFGEIDRAVKAAKSQFSAQDTSKGFEL